MKTFGFKREYSYAAGHVKSYSQFVNRALKQLSVNFYQINSI